MKVLVTGSSRGIGKAIAEKFIREGHCVIGIDINGSEIESKSYTHYTLDVRDKENLPEIKDVDIL